MADDKIVTLSSGGQEALAALTGAADMGEVSEKLLVIGTRKDQLSVGDEVFKFGIDMVILAVAWQRGYYDTKYNPNQKESEAAPPACYSIARGRYLFTVPESNALKPQHTNCEECPKGDIMFKQRAEIERRDGSFHGPECKSRGKLIGLRVDKDGRLLGSLHLLQTYPTAAKKFNEYLQFCKDAFGSAAGAVTHIELGGKEMSFSATGPVTTLGDDALKLALSKLEAAQKVAYAQIRYKTKTAEEVGQTPEEIKAEVEKKATAKARSKI